MNNTTTTESLYYPVSKIKMIRGEGVYLYDEDGNQYIDCASATFNLSLGYSHPEVVAAMKEQTEKLIHITSSFQSDPVNALAENLLSVAPPNMTKVHPKVCSGSVANEGAIKMAQLATGKTEIITLFRSHLGQTMMMTSMSGNAFRKSKFPIHSPLSLQVPDPYCYRCFYDKKPSTCGMYCVDRIEDFMEYASHGQVAAILIEPISGNGGNIVPPKRYFQKLREFCNKHDIILIFDEIQTGIGRTGKMFAAQHFEVEPDAITVAKGLGGSGGQVAAIISNQKLEGMPSHYHSFTYGANLLAATAANVTLNIIKQPEFLANIELTGNYILQRLHDLKNRFHCIADVRGVGLMIGFEINKTDGSPDVELTNALADKALNYGLILRTSRYGFGNVLKIRPPLILSWQEADKICNQLELMFIKEVGYERVYNQFSTACANAA